MATPSPLAGNAGDRRIRFSNPSLESLFCVRQASSPFLNLRQGYFNTPAARI